MGEREIEPILASFREQGSERLRREVLKLVDEEKEVLPFLFRECRSSHRGGLELGYQEGTDQGRLVCAELSFGKIGEEDLGMLHDMGQGKARLHLPEYVANEGMKTELPQLVLDRGNCFPSEAGVVAFVFFLPELPDKRIRDLAHDPAPVGGIREKPIDSE